MTFGSSLYRFPIPRGWLFSNDLFWKTFGAAKVARILFTAEYAEDAEVAEGSREMGTTDYTDGHGFFSADFTDFAV